MRNIIGIIVLLALCYLAGCNSRPAVSPSGADAGFGNWSWHDFKELNPEAGKGGVSASWGSWHKKFAYVILTDAATSASTAINASGARTEYKVNLTLPKGQKAEWRIETADGKTGSAAYDGQSYDLAQGPVFILLPKGEKLEVLQLNRNISDVVAGPESMEKLLKNDQEIARTFAKAQQ